jgi:hypothetical protein
MLKENAPMTTLTKIDCTLTEHIVSIFTKLGIQSSPVIIKLAKLKNTLLKQIHQYTGGQLS